MQALLLITIYKASDSQGNGRTERVKRDHSLSDGTGAVDQKTQVKWLIFLLGPTLSTVQIRLLSVSMTSLSLICRTWNSFKFCSGQWKYFCCHNNSAQTEKTRQELCTELPPSHRSPRHLTGQWWWGLPGNHWTRFLDCHMAGLKWKIWISSSHTWMYQWQRSHRNVCWKEQTFSLELMPVCVKEGYCQDQAKPLIFSWRCEGDGSDTLWAGEREGVLYLAYLRTTSLSFL